MSFKRHFFSYYSLVFPMSAHKTNLCWGLEVLHGCPVPCCQQNNDSSSYPVRGLYPHSWKISNTLFNSSAHKYQVMTVPVLLSYASLTFFSQTLQHFPFSLPVNSYFLPFCELSFVLFNNHSPSPCSHFPACHKEKTTQRTENKNGNLNQSLP